MGGFRVLGFRGLLGRLEDFISRLITPEIHIVSLVIQQLTDLLSPPDPPSRIQGLRARVSLGFGDLSFGVRVWGLEPSLRI